MKLTITNDDGEVYATLASVNVPEVGHATGVDDEGEVATISSVLRDADIWERKQQAAPLPIRSGFVARVYPKGGEPGQHAGYTVGTGRTMCRVEGCNGQRFDNWSTCAEHEARGSRVFDR